MTLSTKKLDELLALRPECLDLERMERESPQFFALFCDLLKRGQQSPIILRNGKIYDGIHRLFALWLMDFKGEIKVETDKDV